MAKSQQQQVGMEKAELRTHVKLARRAPVHIAFALGGDGKAIVMMDKRKQPRAILKELKEEAAEARNHRFGAMMFDPDNPKLARITVDKAASGMARKLVVAFKGTGIKQIELMTEDGQSFDSAVNEEDEDEDEDQDGDNAGAEIAKGVGDLASGDIGSGVKNVAEGIGDAIGGLFGGEKRGGDDEPRQDTSAASTDEDSTDQSDGADEQAEGEDQDQQYDPDELKQDLMGLVKRMMGVIAKDPSQKAGLAELATDAQASLKRGDLAQASAGIDVFREALDGLENGSSNDSDGQPDGSKTASADTGNDDQTSADDEGDEQGDEQGQDANDTSADGPDGSDGSAKQAANGDDGKKGGPGAQAVQRYRKSRAVWLATRAKIDADIKKLSDTILGMDHGGAFGDDLEKNFLDTIDPVLSTLDQSLADILSSAENAGSKDEADKALDQARTTIGLYQQFVQSNDTIKELDKNPFMPMQIAKTLNASLAVLTAAMK